MSSVAPARVLQETRVLKRAPALLVDVDVIGVRKIKPLQIQCVSGESVSWGPGVPGSKDPRILISKMPYTQDSKERHTLVDTVVNCIVKLNLPISIVDEPAFVKMLSSFNNRLRVPCRQTFTNTLIPAKASAAKLRLKEILGTIDSCSRTCDGWTSNGSHSYLGNNFVVPNFSSNSIM